MHVVLRPQPWNRVSQAAGYALWALQLACFVRCQLTEVPRLDATWQEHAAAGLEPSERCPRTGLQVPPRARFVRSAGRIILGFDHYCIWLGTPVGAHNRKHFLLFVFYSATFCAMGSVHSIYELTYAMPVRQRQPPFPWLMRTPKENVAIRLAQQSATWKEFGQHSMYGAKFGILERIEWFSLVLGKGGLYAWMVYVSTFANVVGAVLLIGFGSHHLYMVLRNETSLQSGPSAYDLGYTRNWQQVFGQRAWLWALPVDGHGQARGYNYPLKSQQGHAE